MTKYTLLLKTVYWEFPGDLMVKDSALSLLWLRFSPLARDFHMHSQNKKKKILKSTLSNGHE